MRLFADASCKRNDSSPVPVSASASASLSPSLPLRFI
ncbi:rCG45504, partial [Rattus norvegicus]